MTTAVAPKDEMLEFKPRKHYFMPRDDDVDTCLRCGRNFRNLNFHCTTAETPENDAQYIGRLESALRTAATAQVSVMVEELARKLAYDEWPLAPHGECRRFANKNWRLYAGRAKSLLSTYTITKKAE